MKHYSRNAPTMRRAASAALLGLCLAAGLLPRAEALAAAVSFPVTHTADDLQPGSLRSAIAQAQASPGSTVVFQIPASDPGYNSAANTATITLSQGPVIVSAPNGLSIAGGNSPSGGNPPSGAVVVSGGAGAAQSRVFSITAGTVSLSNLTITNGSVSGSTSRTAPGGAGILNAASLTVTSCVITANTVSGTGVGGGIDSTGAGASLTMTGCTVSANADSNGGGGIASDGTLTLTGCTLSGNSAQTGSGTSSGGGLLNTGTATLNSCTLSGNRAGGPVDGGGGGAASSGALTMNNCLVTGNTVSVYGGGLFNTGTLTLNACTLSGNQASRNNYGFGGGIETTGTAQMTNCLLVSNTGATVGGLDNGGTLTLTNSTLAGNISAGFSLTGGTFAGGLRSGPATLLNDILYGDVLGTSTPSEIVAAPGTAGPTVTYSDVQGGYAGTGNISGDPLFVNAAAGDYHLQVASPAFHAGAAGTASNGVPLTDIVGTARPTPPARPSMGAYEVPGTSAGFSAQGGFTVTGTQNSATAAQVVAKFLPGAGGASGFTATIDFGDGTALTAGTISADPAASGVSQVTGSHTYASYGTFTVTVVISGPGGTPTATVTSTATIQPAQVASNVTGQVSVFRGGFYFNRFTKRYSQTVTLTNTSAATVTGPISLALDNLTSGATALGAAGTTQYAPPAGSPYFTVQAGSLAPGATASLFLQLTNPGGGQIDYTPRVLAGPGAR